MCHNSDIWYKATYKMNKIFNESSGKRHVYSQFFANKINGTPMSFWKAICKTAPINNTNEQTRVPPLAMKTTSWKIFLFTLHYSISFQGQRNLSCLVRNKCQQFVMFS